MAGLNKETAAYKNKVSYIHKFNKEMNKRVLISLHKVHDQDIIDAIEKSGNKQGFVKNAIREYIKNQDA